MVPGRLRHQHVSRLVLFMRAMLLALCAALAALGGGSGPRAGWLLAVSGVAVASSALQGRTRLVAVAAVAEAAVVATAVPFTGGGTSPLLPYLAAVAFASGVVLGARGVLLTTLAAGSVLAVAGAAVDSRGPADAYLTASVQWTAVSLTVGLVAAQVSRVVHTVTPTPAERYGEAYRLLDQLRAVTRSLPGSLDPGTAGTVLIERVRDVAAVQRAAVLLVSGDRFVPIALHGARRVPWRPSLTQPGPVYTAWQRRRAVLDRREGDVGGRRQGSTLLVQPLFTGSDRPVGLLLAELLGDDSFSDDAVAEIERIALELAPSLETAALFDELRLLAAAEERTRLAKEMHDGIAQDLAYLGYEVDAVVTSVERSDLDTAVQRLRELRRGMTRLASDLRLSISDLRSSVGPARGVGAALTEYARSAGTGSGITVHVTLAEAPIRLPAEDEIVLLRISHEAIAAARRRRGTRNLWIGLATDPPSFRLCVDDDGEQTPDEDPTRSANLIKELARDLGGDVSISPRPAGGVAVDVRRGEVP